MLRFFFLLSICFANTGIAQELVDATLNHDGLTREYLIYIPVNYNEESQAPLMFNFHGYGDNAENYMEYADMRPMADEDGFLLVYPQGSLDNDGAPFWNVEGPSTTKTVDDIGFVEAMMDAMIENYAVDESRIYACGFSNGGFITFDLACRINERLAAVASVASTMMGDSYDECTLDHPTPVILIHGTSDFVVPLDGYLPYLLPIDTVNSFWADANNTDASPVIIEVVDSENTDGSPVNIFEWANGDACSIVRYYQVVDGGHDWPGGWGASLIDAEQEIWDFCSQFDLTGLIGCTNDVTEVNKSKVVCYPNPTSETIVFQSNIAGVEIGTVKVYNNLGVQVGALHNALSGKEYDVSFLSSGVYVLRTSQGTLNLVKI